tara:strand:- start:2382 stop:4106 length:1725 start_codon:yes stop_codon:yes gene_type:complete
MNEKQSSWLGTLAQGSPLGAITEGFGDWGKRKAFDFAPEHFGGKRGKQFGKQFGNLFGMGDQGQELGQQAGRFGGTLYKGLPKGQQNSAYNTMNTMQPMVQQGLDAMTQFAGGMQNKTSAEKQALPTLGLAPILGALAGGAHGAYKAPKGSRPEGLGRGLFRGGAAGAGAGVGGLAGGVGGGILGVAISNAIAGKQNTIDKPYLPLLLALLGGGAGAYGGGKLGWGMASGVTGDNAKLDREEEEKEASMNKQASLAAILAALTGGAAGGYGGYKGISSVIRRILNKGKSLGGYPRTIEPAANMLPLEGNLLPLEGILAPHIMGTKALAAGAGAGVGAGLGYGGARGIEALLGKESMDKRAFLGRALGGIGKGVGDLVGGAGKLGWRGLMRGLGVGKDVAPTSALTKGLTLGAGGLGLSAINEVLASTKGGPIELPHFGMGGDQPWWDPMMQHGRMDPKKTGFKSLLHMGARPLQTIAALTGMAGKPGSLSDFARTKGEGSRLSDFVQDPKNYRIDPVTGRGIVTGEVPISLDPSIMERMQDFHKEKEFMERMGLVRGRGSSSSSSSRRSRGRFD